MQQIETENLEPTDVGMPVPTKKQPIILLRIRQLSFPFLHSVTKSLSPSRLNDVKESAMTRMTRMLQWRRMTSVHQEDAPRSMPKQSIQFCWISIHRQCPICLQDHIPYRSWSRTPLRSLVFWSEEELALSICFALFGFFVIFSENNAADFEADSEELLEPCVKQNLAIFLLGADDKSNLSAGIVLPLEAAQPEAGKEET